MRTVHDGRELELLLSGRKPLAAFSYYDDANENDVMGHQNFEEFVLIGQLLRFDQELTSRGRKVCIVAFTRPEESWRAPAYFQLMRFLYQRSWCPQLEWLQGDLLGYTSAENEAHLKAKYGDQQLRDHC